MKTVYVATGILAVGAAGYAIYALSKKRKEDEDFNSRRFYNNGWNTNVNPVNVVDSALGTTPYQDNLRMALYNRWFVQRS